MAIKLSQGERVVAVVPEHCRGPGWSNDLVWVFIQDDMSGEIRRDALQPSEQTEKMRFLFSIGMSVHQALIQSIPVSVEE